MSKSKASRPSEEEAANRIQHTAAPHNFLTEAMNGELTVAADLVDSVIAAAENPTILDAGCGSGDWAMAMAQKYPRATVTGVDVKPIDLKDSGRSIPNNCFFQILDLETDLSGLQNSFDVIHVRSVASQIVDFERAVDQLFKALKPNGVLVLVAGDQSFYAADRSPLPQDQSVMQRAMRVLHEATLNQGFSIESYLHWHDWLSTRSDVEKVVSQDVWVPVELGVEGAASEMCRRFLLDYTGFMPKGYPEVPEFQGENSLCSQAAQEIREAKLAGVSMRWRFVVGHKTPA
ncbi:hypothetical protein FRC04_005943 [Tulasnella sp. 424]|nr:hypothetical protein FRC04_005943 [Tulasnella sp. 424]KAG8961603.1 hypothetical protein FRC05_005854 [Tulasnella sp. 425]